MIDDGEAGVSGLICFILGHSLYRGFCQYSSVGSILLDLSDVSDSLPSLSSRMDGMSTLIQLKALITAASSSLVPD